MTDRAQPSLLVLIESIFGLLLAGAALLFFLNRDMPKAPEAAPPPSSAAPVQPLDQTAEDRAYEAMRKVHVAPEASEVPEKAERNTAAPVPLPLRPAKRSNREPGREALPATTLALNCERLRKAYSDEELKKIPGFKEKCTQ
ncbi:MAG TPA: hypothetical protein VJQ77_06955 [Novosphingobium sp.]|nr:hypothetical protein [Novosphingobium sp.]